jgi:hypothetical protein
LILKKLERRVMEPLSAETIIERGLVLSDYDALKGALTICLFNGMAKYPMIGDSPYIRYWRSKSESDRLWGVTGHYYMPEDRDFAGMFVKPLVESGTVFIIANLSDLVWCPPPSVAGAVWQWLTRQYTQPEERTPGVLKALISYYNAVKRLMSVSNGGEISPVIIVTQNVENDCDDGDLLMNFLREALIKGGVSEDKFIYSEKDDGVLSAYDIIFRVR